MVNRRCTDYMDCDHVRCAGSCDGCGNAGGAMQSTIEEELYKRIMQRLDSTKSKATYAPFQHPGLPSIKKVIFNNPATIIIWEDSTKTIVKCGPNDIYDPEKGMAMAIAKKALGNKGNFNEVFKKWLPKEDTEVKTFEYTVSKIEKTNGDVRLTIEADCGRSEYDSFSNLANTIKNAISNGTVTFSVEEN